jgi:hypothetical protein
MLEGNYKSIFFVIGHELGMVVACTRGEEKYN